MKLGPLRQKLRRAPRALPEAFEPEPELVPFPHVKLSRVQNRLLRNVKAKGGIRPALWNRALYWNLAELEQLGLVAKTPEGYYKAKNR